jgi:hypothetical protein
VVLGEERPEAKVTLRLPVGGTVRGRVVDPKGQPIGHAFITTKVSRDSFRNPLTRQDTFSRGDGSFVLEHLAPGEYQLTVRAIGWKEKRVPVTVQEGETSTVEVVLERWE